MSGGTFGGVVRNDTGWTSILDFEKADAAIDPVITTTGGDNRTRVGGAGSVLNAPGARIQHKIAGRTNTLKSSVDMSDAAYWLQNAGGWWVSTASFDKAPPKRGAKATKYVRTAAAAGDAVFARCNSLSIPAGNRSASVYFYVPSGQGISTFKVRADWQDALGGTYTDSSLFDQWVRIDSTGTTVSTASFLDLNIQVDGFNVPATGFTFYCAAPQESDVLSDWIPTGAAPVTVYDSYGLFNEPSVENALRNNTSVGAAVGVPGTIPTRYFIDRSAGQTVDVAAIGSEVDMNYVDFRCASAANDRAYLAIYVEGNGVNGLPANPAEVWTAQLYGKISAGTAVGTQQLWLRQQNSGGATIIDSTVSTTLPSASAALSTGFVYKTVTTPALTAYVTTFLLFGSIPVGPAFDFTVRIGLPQMTKTAFPVSPIKTAGSAVTAVQARSFISGAAFTQYFQNQGTYLIEFTPIALTHGEVYWGIGQYGVFNNSMYLLNSSGVLYLIVYSAGVLTAASDLGPLTAGVRHKVAISFKSGEIAARCNGGVERVSAGAMPAVIDNEGLLTSPWVGGSGGVNAYMHVRKYKPVPSRGDLYQLTV